MNKKIKIKGQLKTYMQWTLFMGVLLIAMTLCLFLVNIKSAIIVFIFTLVYVTAAVVLFLYNKPLLMNELISFATNYNQVQRKLLHELALPYALLDDTGRFIWLNKSFQKELGKDKFYGKSITSFFSAVTKDTLPKDETPVSLEVNYEEKDYQMEMKMLNLSEMSEDAGLIDMESYQGCVIAIYLFDITRMKYYMRENEEQKLVAGLIYLDNYEEALETVEEVRRSLLIALIDRKVNKWIGDLDGLVKKVEKDKYFIVMKQKYLTQMQEDKFSILDDVRKVNIGNEMAVTLSIGIGSTGITYAQNYMYARTAIDLALGRGGNQAVVKKKDKIYYYGGKTKQVEKSTRVKARVKAQALREIMENKDKVFVMGHTRADIDSFGAAVGIYKAAKVLNKKVYIVIDEITSSVKPMIECFYGNKEYQEDMFISGAEALEQVDSNSVLVVVDVNKPSITECQELLRLAKTIVVLDHHRQGEEVIQNAVLSYIEPYASSTCEMVAEILQYFNEEIIIRSLEADCLYAGIMIDTNNFMNKTGVRTFEAAAFLRRCGADVARVHKLYRDDFATIQAKAEAIRNAELYHDSYVIAECADCQVDSPTVLGAQVANELLNVLEIKASFVLTEYQSRIYISARSMDEINVQLIMERLGGGGHMNVAAAQLENHSIQEAKNRLKSLLDEMIKEGDI